MENRIKQIVKQMSVGALPSDFYDLVILYGPTYPVSREVAHAIERQLKQVPPPDWIVFRDLMGSRHRVRTSQIRQLVENTREQRRLFLEFLRQRGKERKEDAEPGDDELDLW
jgi:hypothetical protein